MESMDEGERPGGLMVDREQGERAKKILVSLGLLDSTKRIARFGAKLVFPLRADADDVLPRLRLPGSELVAHAEQAECWGIVMIDGSTGWIAKSAVELTERTVPPEKLEILLKGGRPDIVQEAFRFLGTSYRYGGRLPYDMDCSLLVQTAYAARGISLPRTAREQFERGRPVDYTELLPGDRLYFVSRSGRINHTGIYIGNGRFIHASSRRGCVAVDGLTELMYWTRFVGARRS